MGITYICLGVSMMSSHMALPREGHVSHLIQVFSYICKYHNSELVFDLSDPVIDMFLFERKEWTYSEFEHIKRK